MAVAVGVAIGSEDAQAAPASPSTPTAGHALIQGSGSSWAANAVNQWVSDVHQNGLQVVFTSSGSAQGRQDFANKTVDYAVSDIGYQGTDPVTQQADTSQGRAYAYLPITAGGTSFPYQLHGQGGVLIRNLRLSGAALSGIFTGSITNWNDPIIKKDNPQISLPDLKIIPVVHSEGSGSSYQFTRYLDTEFKPAWVKFLGKDTPTEYFPTSRGNEVSESGSDGVINFLTSSAGNGAIAFDEYSYALGKNYPVAKVLNSKGYYTLPNQYNVAVAMQGAKIDTTDVNDPSKYLLQDLNGVYTYPDARAYPLSSYSYMIIPTAAKDQTMTTAKRQTLADYLYYSICQGQKEIGPIGYSPLTLNLVSAGFDQIAKLHTADGNVDLNKESVSTCNNPTFIAGDPSGNYLAKIAPEPPACDAAGTTQCATNGNTGQQNPVDGKAPVTGDTTSGGTTGQSGSAGSTSSGGSGGSTGTAATGSSGSAATGAAGSSASGGSTASGGGTAGDDFGSGSSVTGGGATTTAAALPAKGGAGVPVAVIAALLLLALLAGPPLVGLVLARRSR